jgi:hypothetical protein
MSPQEMELADDDKIAPTLESSDVIWLLRLRWTKVRARCSHAEARAKMKPVKPSSRYVVTSERASEVNTNAITHKLAWDDSRDVESSSLFK